MVRRSAGGALVIHVVVVAYRSAEHIQACLEPILGDGLVSSVVVVDNSADPATKSVCRQWADDRLEYLPSENVGYAIACNVGLARRRGNPEFVAVVNPDVTLSRSLGELAKHSAGVRGTVFSARLEQGATMNARQMVSPWRELLSALVGGRAYWLSAFKPTDPRFVRVPQIDGSLFLVSSGEADALAGFDERFELYYEDVDYCRRANQRAGCHMWVEPWGKHRAGASFAVAGEPAFVTLRVSRLRYLRKWYGRIGLPVALAVGSMESIVRSVTGHAPSRGAVVRALVAQFREVGQPGRGSYLG